MNRNSHDSHTHMLSYNSNCCNFRVFLTTYDKVYMPRPGRFLGMTPTFSCVKTEARNYLTTRTYIYPLLLYYLQNLLMDQRGP